MRCDLRASRKGNSTLPLRRCALRCSPAAERGSTIWAQMNTREIKQRISGDSWTSCQTASSDDVNGEVQKKKKREGELARTEDSVEGAPFLQNGAPCLPSLIAVVAPADHGGFPRILQAPQTPAPTRVDAGFSCLGRIVSASLFAHQNHPKGLAHAPKGHFFASWSWPHPSKGTPATRPRVDPSHPCPLISIDPVVYLPGSHLGTCFHSSPSFLCHVCIIMGSWLPSLAPC